MKKFLNYRYIKVKVNESDVTITLARPEKRNAFTPSMISEIAHAFQCANEDDTIRLVWLKAEGPVFCAGMDLKVFRDPASDEINPQIGATNQSVTEVFESLHKPSIAVLEGDVIAGAFLFILGCTYVFAASDVTFRLPEVSIGLFPFQVMGSLLRVMPEKKVLQMCLDPRPFSARQALEKGLLDGLLGDPELEKLAETLRTSGGTAIGLGFETLNKLKSIPPSGHQAFLVKTLNQLRKEP